MPEISAPGSQSHSPTSTGKPSGGRQRVISSCLTCRRRKVRCDHVHPICGACTRGNHVCTYATDPVLSSTATKIAKPALVGNAKSSKNSDVQARLDRLELLLERAVTAQSSQNTNSAREELLKRDHDSQLSSSNSQSSHAGLSSDHQDGTLLLDGEQSQFVSSLHYALLADEIQDIKALLGDRADEGADGPTTNNLKHLLSLGKAKIGVTLENLYPTQEQRGVLLDAYFSNVDPMVRIIHKPTLLRKFPTLIRDLHPMGFAILYSAVNSLPGTVVETKFGENKEDWLAQLEMGVEIGLARDNYLTTSSLEILQAFVLWLSCITREEDMGKAWVLLGVAVRIALNQGLHRDPSLFPSGSWDAVTVETRRRVWHQICQLEFRAAEFRGQEPSVSEEDYTTMLPRNVEDEDLVEGASPGPSSPYDEFRFTSMTFQVVRLIGVASLRRLVKKTYKLERRMLESGLRGTSGPDPAQELQNMFEEIKVMVDNMHEEFYRKYLRFCNPDNPIQRLTLGLATLMEWRCYLLFWLRMPRAYRDVVFSSKIRKSIFEKSINCIETLNGASSDVEAARWRWHIGGHAAFQAIMHVLSELRNPLFDVPDRQRAIQALQASIVTKEHNRTKAWGAVKSMIAKVIGEQASDMPNMTAGSASYPGNRRETQSMSLDDSMNANAPVYGQQQMSAYSAPEPQQPLIGQPASQPSLQQGPIDMDQIVFNWDDMNFNNINNIVGDGQATTELPEFDFGFWGDPVNFGTEAFTLPLEGGYAMPWSG